MIKSTEVFYFSPTGGTKKCAETVANALAEASKLVDLGKVEAPDVTEELVVIAAPVFGGRLPSFLPERIKHLNGQGKKAVTIVVYGVRAYEDALRELNDLTTDCGFQIVASAALVAQHSVAKAVGSGRPDSADLCEIKEFAQRVAEKLAATDSATLAVPGNTPYKPMMKLPVTPICLEHCEGCGRCMKLCPTRAITMNEDSMPQTDVQKCILCMACVAHCPLRARVLPPPVQQTMDEKLAPLKEVRRANEFYI